MRPYAHLPIACALVCGVLALVAGAAEAASCRHRPPLRTGLKERVEALRLVEREAADRLKGLDSRTFDYLAAQARANAAAVANPKLLRMEAALSRCRLAAAPARRSCSRAGDALAKLMEGRTPRETAAARQVYAQAMPKCEALLGLKPFATILRVAE